MLPLTATDLFAGAGGLSEGLRQAGWKIVAAANHWDRAIQTHQLAHPETEHNSENLSEVDYRTFPRTTLLAGAPSCVWHARAGGRKRPPAEVERLRLDAGAIDRATAFAIISAAEVHQYPVILVENVVEFGKWSLYSWWLDGLRALGYDVHVIDLDAKDFGHAQNRKRRFVLATRGVHIDLTRPRIAPVFATEILDDIPLEPVTRKLYVAPQIEEIRQERVLHLVTYRNHAHARRADRHQLATISAGGNHHAVAEVIGGRAYHRMLTNRECARGQGFRDSYQFAGTPAEVKKQIGNAVPVGIAAWFGTRIREALERPQPATGDLLDLLALDGAA